MKKILTLLLSGILVMGMSVGCQSRDKVDEGIELKQDDLDSSIEQGKDTTVELTLWGAEEDSKLLDDMVESFKKEYSSQANFDITVEYHSESQCKNDLFRAVEDGPDVFTFADDQLRAMVAAGMLNPVPEAETIKASNVESAVEAASVNDTLYAYPMTADNGYFLYYNKDYFTEEDVQSMDTMLKIAEAAHKKISMEWTSGWYLYAFFGRTGLEMGLNDDGVSNYCNWNATDTPIKGIDVAKGMLAIAKSPGFLNCTDDEFVDGVKTGNIIAGVSGIWNATMLEEEWAENYAATKLPTYTCGNQQVQMASFAGYKMVGVNDYSEHIDWAHQLAKWITNEQNQVLRFNQRGQGPSNVTASTTSEIANSQAIQAVLKQSEYADLQRLGNTYWEPVEAFGKLMAEGNPQGMNLQEVLDTMTEGITLSYSYGG